MCPRFLLPPYQRGICEYWHSWSWTFSGIAEKSQWKYVLVFFFPPYEHGFSEGVICSVACQPTSLPCVGPSPINAMDGFTVVGILCLGFLPPPWNLIRLELAFLDLGVLGLRRLSMGLVKRGGNVCWFSSSPPPHPLLDTRILIMIASVVCSLWAIMGFMAGQSTLSYLCVGPSQIRTLDGITKGYQKGYICTVRGLNLPLFLVFQPNRKTR